jgi:2,4-dienoyl-CoA reductase-like NADH-dependent reductase (Old Yellow Enzyme family)
MNASERFSHKYSPMQGIRVTNPKLFTPYALRAVTFPNRVIVSPMCQYAAQQGEFQEWHLAHHARFALSGVGGAVVEATSVTEDGRITPGCLGIWHDGQIEGIPVGIQIGHAGRKASSALPWDGAGPLDASTQAWATVAPSALPHMAGWPTPRALAESEIAIIVEAFAEGARRAVRAGFDFIEIHGAHGYLIHSFFSPLANRRADSYGGSLHNRMRFALEVTRAVRTAIPTDMPLVYRISAVDNDPAGLTIGDSITLAKELKIFGVDLMDVSSGGIAGPVARNPVAQFPGYQVPFSAEIRAGADIATMAVGMITTAEQAEKVLEDGQADLIALGRELLANPAFAYGAAQALGMDAPSSVLPRAFAFYLARRDQARLQKQNDQARQSPNGST